MSTPMLAAAIVLSAAITFGLRALPFLIFSGEREEGNRNLKNLFSDTVDKR